MDTTTLTRPAAATLAELPASSIQPGNNDRTIFDPVELANLAESIRLNGLAQRPTVRPIGDRFEIVAGERRFRAMTQILGWATVPVVVEDMDDVRASALMLIENLQRVDLDPIAEGQAYKRRMDAESLTHAQLAERIGVSWNRVEAKVRLLRLIPQAQHLVRIGRLGETAAWACDVLDHDRQMIAVSALVREDLDGATFRALCAQLHAAQDQEVLFDSTDPDSFWQIEEWVAAAKQTRRPGVKALGDLLRRIVEATDAGHQVEHLLDEARLTVAAL